VVGGEGAGCAGAVVVVVVVAAGVVSTVDPEVASTVVGVTGPVSGGEGVAGVMVGGVVVAGVLVAGVVVAVQSAATTADGVVVGVARLAEGVDGVVAPVEFAFEFTLELVCPSIRCSTASVADSCTVPSTF